MEQRKPRDIIGYRDASSYSIDELFDPELRARNEWLGYLETRPYIDKDGIAYDPLSDQAIDAEEYFAAKVPNVEGLVKSTIEGGNRSDVDEAVKQTAFAEVAVALAVPVRRVAADFEVVLDEKSKAADPEAEAGQPTPVVVVVREPEVAPDDDQNDKPTSETADPDIIPTRGFDLGEVMGQAYLEYAATPAGRRGNTVVITDTRGNRYEAVENAIYSISANGSRKKIFNLNPDEYLPNIEPGKKWRVTDEQDKSRFVDTAAEVETVELVPDEPKKAEPVPVPTSSGLQAEGGKKAEAVKPKRGKRPNKLGRKAVSVMLAPKAKFTGRAKSAESTHRPGKIKVGLSVASLAILAGGGIFVTQYEHGSSPKQPTKTEQQPTPSPKAKQTQEQSSTPRPTDIKLKPGQKVKISKDGKSASINF